MSKKNLQFFCKEEVIFISNIIYIYNKKKYLFEILLNFRKIYLLIFIKIFQYKCYKNKKNCTNFIFFNNNIQ